MVSHASAGSLKTGAPMDYAEHEKTYHHFLALVKYGALLNIALLMAMSFFFFATTGGAVSFIFALVLFGIITLVGARLLSRFA